MLDFLGHRDAHDAIIAAIEAVLDPRGGGPKTRDLGGTATTSDLGRAVAGALAAASAASREARCQASIARAVAELLGPLTNRISNPA
jgi:tartrate dehydrogenase/decarboxylase/D-malate dehydrogenase